MSEEFWEEDHNDDMPPAVTDDVVDLAFRIRGRTLPADHAWPLADALIAALSWFADEPATGLHLIHAAASGNGWVSPEDDDEGVIYLSRRTCLTLRLPQERVAAAARTLEGATLDVVGHPLEIGASQVHLLSPLTTLYARHVVAPGDDDEGNFLAAVVHELEDNGITCRRMVCGRTRHFHSPQGPLLTRSLMLADLDFAESQRLQRIGLGPGPHHGFGLFIPHKAVK